METLIRVVGQYAQWIYALCGFTALYNIYKTWQIRAERRQAVFTLERQKAVDDLYKILFTSFILLIIMGITYFVGDVMATAMGLDPPPRSLSENLTPNTVGGVLGDTGTFGNNGDEFTEQQSIAVEDEQSKDGNATTSRSAGTSIIDGTIDDGNTAENIRGSNDAELTTDAATQIDTEQVNAEQVNTGQVDSFQVDSFQVDSAQVNIDTNQGINIPAAPTAPQPLPTPTFTYAPPPPPPPTIIPTAIPVVSSPTCADTRARINSPSDGAIVSGSFNVVGSATHEQLQFYKVEYAPGTNRDQEFVYLAGGNNPINGGILATIDSTIWTNGTWTIRLVVVDQTGNFPTPCYVTITASN